MRALPLLAIPALFAGCSIPLSFDVSGTLPFTIGDINPNCTIDEDPPKNCTVTTDSSTGECVIFAQCTDLELVDTQEVQAEIDDATNNNDRITARIEGIQLTATNLSLRGFDGGLPEGTTAFARAYTTSNAEAFDLTEDDYLSVVAGTPVVVFDENADDGSPFIDELNTALEDGTAVPITAEITVTIPDVTAFAGASNASGALDWTAAIDGRGGISLRRR